jgi:2-polyprenyl-6-methoxyphenol hydroxylase-like FAD-dependent oxidoreductase
LAAALHRDGRNVELVELEREWNTSGAGLSVQPNGLRVLKSLRLDAGVVGAGCVIGSWLFADDGRRISVMRWRGAIMVDLPDRVLVLRPDR